jgi:pimeloyl-ACP methyl ester carboxylesterase
LRLIAVRPPASAIYTKSECPTLLLFGSRSHWEKSRLGRAETVEVRRTRLERLAARYANLTLKWLPAGHNLHIQQPTQISAAIIAYLRLVGRLGASSKPDRKQAAR